MIPAHETAIQIRFADVDLLGHVNNVNQQHYFDVGKVEFLKEALQINTITQRGGLVLVAITAEYEAQIRPHEPISVLTRVEKIGNKSLTLSQQIINAQSREIKSRGTSTLVAFDFDAQEAIPIPGAWREALAPYIEP